MKPYQEQFRLARPFVLPNVLSWSNSEASGSSTTSWKQSSSPTLGKRRE